MQKLSDFVTAFSHDSKPLLRDRSQFTCTLFHPGIDGRVTLYPRRSIETEAGLVIAIASATVGALVRFQRAPYGIAYWDAVVLLALYIISAQRFAGFSHFFTQSAS